MKLTNTQLNKLKSSAKKYIGTMLRVTKRTFKMKICLMNYF